MKINLLCAFLFCVGCFVSLDSNAAFTIDAPVNGSVYMPGQSINFNWSNCDDDIEEYRWEWHFEGFRWNSSGVAEYFSDGNTGTNDELSECGWDPSRVGPTLSIACNVIVGTYYFSVHAYHSSFCAAGDECSAPGATCAVTVNQGGGSPAWLAARPRMVINCKPTELYMLTSECPDPVNYETYWFDDGNVLLAKGSPYSRTYAPGLVMLKCVYIHKNSHCSDDNYQYVMRDAIASPVFVYTASFPDFPTIFLPDVELTADPDPRTNRAACTDPGTFFILPDNDEVAQVLEDAGTELTDAVSMVAGDFQATGKLIPHVKWVVQDNLGSPGYVSLPNGSKKVCYGILDPANNRGNRCRTYRASVSFTIEATLIYNDPNTQKAIVKDKEMDSDCIKADLLELTICQKKLCTPLWADIVTIYTTPPTETDGGTESTIICETGPVNTIKAIGPVSPLFDDVPWNKPAGMGLWTKIEHTFQWYGPNVLTPASSSLSSVTVRNPTVDWTSMPVNYNQFYKYLLKIHEVTRTRTQDPNSGTDPTETATPKDYSYAALVYKCKWCEGGQRIRNPEEVIMTAQPPVPLLHLYPNPASESVTIEFDPSDREGRLSITDYTGKLLTDMAVPEGTARQEINLSGLQPGMYICILTIPGRPKVSKMLSIIR